MTVLTHLLLRKGVKTNVGNKEKLSDRKEAPIKEYVLMDQNQYAELLLCQPVTTEDEVVTNIILIQEVRTSTFAQLNELPNN